MTRSFEGTEKLIINAAITGMVFSRADSPYVPLTPDEIVTCARQVLEAGASIVHVHARDDLHRPTCDGGKYAEIVRSIREACPDIIVCVSLSGRSEQDVDRRAAPLKCGPDMASLTLGTLNFPTGPSLNSPDAICELASRIRKAGAVPELEVFETGFVNYANYMIRKGELKPPYYFNLFFGSLGTAPLDLLGLGHMISLLPPGATWAAAGIGRHQLDASVLGIVAGGHVRVGLEDNLYYDRSRTLLADNVRLVERVVRIARDMGREPATPTEARAIIGLCPIAGVQAEVCESS